MNESFAVTVYTFGSSGCDHPDHVDLWMLGNVATITPHDRYADPSSVCTADIAARPHPLTLRFTSVGAATIHVDGAVIDAQGNRAAGSADRAVVVTRSQ